jgi:hypothetical protein
MWETALTCWEEVLALTERHRRGCPATALLPEEPAKCGQQTANRGPRDQRAGWAPLTS